MNFTFIYNKKLEVRALADRKIEFCRIIVEVWKFDRNEISTLQRFQIYMSGSHAIKYE